MDYQIFPMPLGAGYAKIFPLLPLSLIEKDSQEKLTQTISLNSIQKLAAKEMIFEAPLSLKKKWGDFMFALDLDNLNQYSTLSLFNNEHWASIVSLVDQIKQDDAYISGLQNIWLELDIGSQPSTWPPLPNLFLDQKEQPAEMLVKNIEKTCAHFKRAVPTKLRAMIQKIVDRGIYIFSVGFMLARPFDGIRLAMRPKSFLSANQMIDFLIDLGHPGFKKKDVLLLNKIIPLVKKKTSIEVDLCEGIFPKVGFGLYPQGRGVKFYDFLTREGLSDAAKTEAILSWHGQRPCDIEFPAFPLLYPCKNKFLIRCPNRAKFVLDPNHELLAKVYLRSFFVSHLRQDETTDELEPSGLGRAMGSFR
jgi:hypothetical protein